MTAIGRDQSGSRAACDYCGLPVGPSKAEGPVFCCFGCRFAAAVAQERGTEGQVRWTLTRLGLSIFFTMNVMVFTMALWSQDVFETGTADSQAAILHQLFRYLILLLALPVLFLLGGTIFEEAVDELRSGRVTTDILLLTGVAAAFLYSVISVIRGEGHVYFEVGCMILVAVTLGRWLEAVGKWKTTEALQTLNQLLPQTVRVVSEDGETSKPIEELGRGDLIHVLAGQRIPADGLIVRNRAAIDEQVLTGESEAVVKQDGDRVLGGTLNLDGDLYVRIEQLPHEGTLQQLADAVRVAAAAKGPHQRLAETIAGWFFPALVLIATTTLIVHWWWGSFHQAMLASLAVVLIACPCALGLATPMAIWAAMGRAAAAQVLFRSGDAVSQLAGVKVICFDKTGTLTTGNASVASAVYCADVDEADVLRHALPLSSASTHSFSRAISEFASRRLPTVDALPVPVDRVDTLPGRGVAGHVLEQDTLIYLGSSRLMEEQQLRGDEAIATALHEAQSSGRPVACLGWDGRIVGVFIFREQVRVQAKAAFEELRSSGLHLAILTGDQSVRAASIRQEFGVELSAEMLPEDKAEAVSGLRRQYGQVAMVGDGMNDAPALATADVGIAMGCGTDIAHRSASVCLLGDDLSRLPWAVGLAKATVRTIRQNLFWAFAYNTVGIVLAVAGWLNPVIAAIAMAVSSFCVVSNSLRLKSIELGPESKSAVERISDDEGNVSETADESTRDVDRRPQEVYG